MNEEELVQTEAEEQPEKREESLEELLDRVNRQNTGEAEHRNFTVVSDINKADYRYFFYFSAILKSKLVLILYLLLPIGLAFAFALNKNGFAVGVFIVMSVVFYLTLALLQIIRTESKLAKIKKNSPTTLHTTRTKYTFAWDGIIHTKNEETTRVKYGSLSQVCRTKSRIILYFKNNKAMILHPADVEKVIPLDEFVAFVNSKIKK